MTLPTTYYVSNDVKFCSYCKWVCAKEIKDEEIPIMQKRSKLLMCNLEEVFPPAFFDMQTHLVGHLVHEVAIAGPVHARWMYWVERYLKTLKSWVWQPARPEGSMATGYLHNESLFLSGGMISILDKEAPIVWEEAQDDRQEGERLMGAAKRRSLYNDMFRKQIHNYVLQNAPELFEWRESYRYIVLYCLSLDFTK